VVNAQVVQDQEHRLACTPATGGSVWKNSMGFSWLRAPSTIIHLALLWLVTIEIIDSFWRAQPTARVTGV
jgi:hypothetical protein